MKLQGHLTDYPLSLLFAILDNRRETGRLLVDFESAPGIFHFKDGKLTGATVGALKGLPAVRVAFLLAEAPFQFDITEGAGIDEETRINDSDRQEIVSRLLGVRVPDANEGVSPLGGSFAARVSTNIGTEFPRAGIGGLATPGRASRILLTAEDVLMYLRCHVVLAIAIVGLLLAVPGVIALTANLGSDSGPTPPPVIDQDPTRDRTTFSERRSFQPETVASPQVDFGYSVQHEMTTPEPPSPKLKKATSAATPLESRSDQVPVNANAAPKAASLKTIAVVIQIEQGRVSEAYVKDPNPGWEALEATALRRARLRRYSPDKSGSETISVKVSVDR